MNIVPSDKCSFCNLYSDTIEHRFWECLVIKDFWLQVSQLWNDVNNVMFFPDVRSITFGMTDSNVLACNLIIFYGKKYISNANIQVQYPNVKRFAYYCQEKFPCNDPNSEKLANFLRAILPDCTV